MMYRRAIALVGFVAASGLAVGQGVLDFESAPPDTSNDGSLTSYIEVVGAVTVRIHRVGGAAFDVFTEPNPDFFDGGWLTQALSPFGDSAGTPLIADFSAPVTAAGILTGDFGGDDDDTNWMRAYAGLGGTGALLDSDSVGWGLGDMGISTVGDPPVALSVASSVGIRSIVFAAGGSAFPNSMYFDNLRVGSIVPEPATMGALALGALALLRRRRR
jgi:hypothetical protein